MFFKKVDMRSRAEMTKFLKGHFRYHTTGYWNRSTSYANNVKIYNLGLPKDVEDKLWDLLDCPEIYDFNDLIDDFEKAHDYHWQAGFNGRSGGYLVLYQGGEEPSGYKSFCTVCGQKNYTSVKETGNKCGRCGNPSRVDFASTHMRVFTRPGMPTDMGEDYEDWTMAQLRERVKLVQEFDQLADDIVAKAVYIAENFSVEEEIVYRPERTKVLVEKMA